MAGIRDVMKDILAQLSTLPIINGDGRQTTPYVRVWNNQLKQLLDSQGGEIESFPLPALFLEILNGTRYETIGQGFRDADITARIHILHEYYNTTTDSTTNGVEYEQDLDVFTLRDNLIILLEYFTPSGCGPMDFIAEDQDYDHPNVYHYITDFVCNFTDSKGSRLDTGRNVYTPAIPPLTLTENVDLSLTGGIQVDRTFVIPKK